MGWRTAAPPTSTRSPTRARPAPASPGSRSAWARPPSSGCWPTIRARSCRASFRTKERYKENWMPTLLEKIKRHEAKVAVIGIGYVGLPLCTEMARAGFHTTGYDKHEAKVKSVPAGEAHIADTP